MMASVPFEGGADEPLRSKAHEEWMAAARQAGRDLAGFDPHASLEQRVAWALQVGLLIATVYTRYSSKHQHSTADQIRATVAYAARVGMYVPPELISVDEAVKGRRERRDGLKRLKAILAARVAAVLLVFKASRLFRKAHEGYRLIQEEVVEENLRAVSVSEGIDTNQKGWKTQVQMYGVMDEALLDAIADFVREGHIGLFKNGYTTGAVGVGLRREEVPGGRPTKRGLPRTKAAVDPAVAEMIRQHATWLLEGMPVAEGVRRWRRAGGPADPRSTTGRMSREAYIHLFTNLRLAGQTAYGRMRNQWSTKRDYVKQVPQPDAQVTTADWEDLRILPDEQIHALRRLILGRKTGPRPPRAGKRPNLWGLVTDVFKCHKCKHRLYTGGARGTAMRCPTPDCPNRVIVDREQAVRAVVGKLTELLRADAEMVDRIAASTVAQQAATPDDLAQSIADLERKDRALSNRIDDLTDLSGAGTDADRAELKAKVRAAQAERAGVRADLARLRTQTEGREPITAERVRATLAEFDRLLIDAAAGTLGDDAVYKAGDIFRRLVGGRVVVIAEARTGRKKAVVRGRFVPEVVRVVAGALGSADVTTDATEVEVWLREPPRLDAIAADVRRLYEDEGLGFRAIAKLTGIGCGNVYMSYKRYYELQGLPVPPRRPRGRHKRSP